MSPPSRNTRAYPVAPGARNERGVVLILVLILLVALVFGATAFLSVVVAEREVTVMYRLQSLCDHALESGKQHAIGAIEQAYSSGSVTTLGSAWVGEFVDTPDPVNEHKGGVVGLYPWNVPRHKSTWGELVRIPTFTPYPTQEDEDGNLYDATGYYVYHPSPELIHHLGGSKFQPLEGVDAQKVLWPRWIYIGYFDVNWRPTEEEEDARYMIRYTASIIDLAGLLLANRTVAWAGGGYAHTTYTAEHQESLRAILQALGGTNIPAGAAVVPSTDSFNWKGLTAGWLATMFDFDAGKWGSDAEKQAALWTPFGNSDMRVIQMETDESDPAKPILSLKQDAAGRLVLSASDPAAVKWQVNINTAPRKVLEAMLTAIDARLGATFPDTGDPKDPIYSTAGRPTIAALVDIILDGRPFTSDGELFGAVGSATHIEDDDDWGIDPQTMDWRIAALLGYRSDGQGFENPLYPGDASKRLSTNPGTFTGVALETGADGTHATGTLNHGMHLAIGMSRFYRVMVRAQVHDLTLRTTLLESDYEFVYQVDPDGSGVTGGTLLRDSNILYQRRHEGE